MLQFIQGMWQAVLRGSLCGHGAVQIVFLLFTMAPQQYGSQIDQKSICSSQQLHQAAANLRMKTEFDNICSAINIGCLTEDGCVTHSTQTVKPPAHSQLALTYSPSQSIGEKIKNKKITAKTEERKKQQKAIGDSPSPSANSDNESVVFDFSSQKALPEGTLLSDVLVQ